MVCSWEILTASTISLYLRHSDAESCPVETFTYCWVMVEPPPTPPVAWFHSARPMPVRSKPGLE